jgi:hypothetical protein
MILRSASSKSWSNDSSACLLQTNYKGPWQIIVHDGWELEHDGHCVYHSSEEMKTENSKQSKHVPLQIKGPQERVFCTK